LTTIQMADLAYDQAEDSLLFYADDNALADDVATLDQYRRGYEAVRTELLECYPDLEGPVIGDLLGEAAAAVWPAIVDAL
jgi:hypothetical protein